MKRLFLNSGTAIIPLPATAAHTDNLFPRPKTTSRTRSLLGRARHLLLLLALVGFLAPSAGFALSPIEPFANFPSEVQAQQHCPGDAVVWLNLPTGIYHAKGQRWYGRTKSGAYVCRTEADHAGMRGSLNGQ